MRSWGFDNVTNSIPRIDGPPQTKFDYKGNLTQVKKLGERNSTCRSEFELETGIFWAYDGEARPALANDLSAWQSVTRCRTSNARFAGAGAMLKAGILSSACLRPVHSSGVLLA